MLRRCGAQIPGPLHQLRCLPGYLLKAEARGICKQVSQIAALSTTNVLSRGHRLTNTAIKIRCQDDCISLSVPSASRPRANTESLNPTGQQCRIQPPVQPRLSTPLWTQPALHQIDSPFLFFTLCHLLSDPSPFLLFFLSAFSLSISPAQESPFPIFMFLGHFAFPRVSNAPSSPHPHM